MEKEKKITKKDNFIGIKNFIQTIESLTDEERARYLAFCNHEIELLDKKAMSKSTGKNSKEQDEVIEKIVNALKEINTPITITELQKTNDTIAEYSNQKLSAMLKKLVDTGKVNKIKDKRQTKFSLA